MSRPTVLAVPESIARSSHWLGGSIVGKSTLGKKIARRIEGILFLAAPMLIDEKRNQMKEVEERATLIVAKRKFIDEYLFEIVDFLIGTESIQQSHFLLFVCFFKRAFSHAKMPYLKSRSMKDLYKERSYRNICGNCCCKNPPRSDVAHHVRSLTPQLIGKQYRLSLAERRTYDIKKLKYFCSEDCLMQVSLWLLEISDESFYVRPWSRLSFRSYVLGFRN